MSSDPRSLQSAGWGEVLPVLTAMDLRLVDEVERVGVRGWPPTAVEELSDGWILRATPGLVRGRSNNALTPRDRPLTDEEWCSALRRVRAWSALHGIRGGLQVSPLELHASVVPRLLAAGWERDFRVWVMVADREEVLYRATGASPGHGREGSAVRRRPAVDPPFADLEWICGESPDLAWQEAWVLCRESRVGVDVHLRTVFQNMNGRGRFGRLGAAATGIAVEDDRGEWAGLFALVVRPGERGQGLGRRLVVEMVRSVAAPRIYLQVEMNNTVAQQLYASLGFRRSHSYQHLRAPLGWATAEPGVRGGLRR